MKCFYFTKDEEEGGGTMSTRESKVSWVRSLSVASSSVDTRKSRSELDSESRDFSDSFEFHELLNQRRGNDLRVFSFSELKMGTKGFSRGLMIGEGGFGCVYRGVVDGVPPCEDMRIEVAGHKEWINEVNFLGVVKHPNLVKLIGYCAEDDERGMQRLLVYELMRNKSLEDHLLARSATPLSWTLRLKIAQDAARGLAYLHEEMDFQLIFRDFKPSNILLDEDFNAKLSDFGLARQGPAAGLTHVSTSVVGTIGYAAPEYVQTGRLTAKSDVWSFGVVLYELITGRRVLERNLPRAEQKLLEWVRPYVSDTKKFHCILDPRLEGHDCIKSAQRLASLANKCLSKNARSRPRMSEVVDMLESIITDAAAQAEAVPETVKEAEDVNEEATKEEVDTKEEGKGEAESGRPESNNQKWVFDFKEMVSFRNKSIGKIDWRNWKAGLIKTS
ncbi:Receptor-like serine/threonine-protein kinase [Capsicum annuum]|uniref:Receptor-like serine/threonine-protein kinase n=1 Tax=Capsicum annuum TaxID=4072 RepID=A0A2G2Z814_CAPAN|nr:Receptor-like serine/threonine-protein kinase [Capsicum annuum]